MFSLFFSFILRLTGIPGLFPPHLPPRPNYHWWQQYDLRDDPSPYIYILPSGCIKKKKKKKEETTASWAQAGNRKRSTTGGCDNTMNTNITESQMPAQVPLVGMFNVRTSAEATIPTTYTTCKQGFLQVETNPNNTQIDPCPSSISSNPDIAIRPVSIAQMLPVKGIHVFSSALTLPKNCEITSVNPDVLYFNFINGYAYPLDARPTVNIQSTDKGSKVAYDIYLDQLYLIQQWNLRDVRVTFTQATTSSDSFTLHLKPTLDKDQTGMHLFVNNVAASEGVTLDAGGVPIVSHYNNTVTPATTETKSKFPAHVAVGRVLDYWFMSQVSHLMPTGGWGTYQAPNEGQVYSAAS